jgi:hypothetical protein
MTGWIPRPQRGHKNPDNGESNAWLNAVPAGRRSFSPAASSRDSDGGKNTPHVAHLGGKIASRKLRKTRRPSIPPIFISFSMALRRPVKKFFIGSFRIVSG